jgi:hypothetical protein|tara:strand:- start:430 stop:615 length:186 start_codon:yes stop_codon:yes gene_type:complete
MLAAACSNVNLFQNVLAAVLVFYVGCHVCFPKNSKPDHGLTTGPVKPPLLLQRSNEEAKPI